METPTSYSNNRRALQLIADNPVRDTRSHRTLCHDLVCRWRRTTKWPISGSGLWIYTFTIDLKRHRA